MAIKVYKGGSWVNTTGVSAIGKADRLAIGQTDTSLATSDKLYYLSFVDENHPHTSRQYEDFYTGIGLTFSPISKSLGVDGVLYLSGLENNFQGSIRSYGGADKLFVLYNESAEGVISINPANSGGLNNTGIATFKRGSAAADDHSYFRSNVGPPKECSGIYNLGKADEKWNYVYANCFIGNGGALDGTGDWKEDVYKNLKAGTCAGTGIVEKTCYNIFVGAYAGCKTTGASGANETAIDEVGDANVFLGIAAGRCNTTGSRNFYGGYAAGRGKNNSTSTGSANIFIGRSAGQEIDSGSNNTFLGKYAGLNIDSGNNNIILGTCAGFYTSSASQVTTLGVFAGYCNNSGNNGVFLGTYAGRNVTSGAGNVAIGMNALRGEDGTNITGALNVALGLAAGRTLGPSGEVLGQGNVFLGANAAENQTAGDFNIAIGYNVCLANTTSSGQLAIGVADRTWLSGDNNFNIRPGRGIIDCTGSCGTSSQVLTSHKVEGTGGNPDTYYVKWQSNSATATNANALKITENEIANTNTDTHYIWFGNDSTKGNFDGMQIDKDRLVYKEGRVGINTNIVGQELNVFSENFSGIRVKSARIASAPMDTMTQIGGLQFADSDGDVSTYPNGKTMSAIVGTVGGDLILKTGNVATDNGSYDRVTITPVGHVGIGTTNPITDDPNNGKTIKDYLEDNNKVLAVGVVTARDYYGTFRGTIDASADVVTDKIKASDGTYAQVVDGGTDGHFKVLTEGNEKLRLIADGKMGLGVNAPLNKLHLRNSASHPKIRFDRGDNIRNNYIGIEAADALVLAADDDNLGNDSYINFRVDGKDKLHINSIGKIGLGKDVSGTWTIDFGTDNQVLTSKGPNAAAVWQTISGIPASTTNQVKVTKTSSETKLYLTGVKVTDNSEGTTVDKTLYQKTAGTPIQTNLYMDTQNNTLHVNKIRGEVVDATGKTWPEVRGNLVLNGSNFIPDSVPSFDSEGVVNGGQNIGSENYKFANVYAQNFVGHLGGTADSTDKIKIQKNESEDASHYFGMVKGAGDTGSPNNQTVYTDTALTYNPNSDILTSSNIKVTTLLNVEGNTTLGNDANVDTITFTGKVNSSVLPKTDATDKEDVTGLDLGGSGAYWRTIYAREFKGSVVGDAESAQTLDIGTDDDDSDRYLTFVDGNGKGKNVYMDSELKYNPNNDTLTPVNLSVTGDTTLGSSLAGEDPDTTIFNSHVTSHIIPGGTLTSPGDYTSYNLGESNRKWNTVYAENFSGSFTGSIEKIKTNKSENQETTYLTFTTTTPDAENRDSYLLTNPHLYFRSESTNPGEKLTVDCQLDVTGDATFAENVTFGNSGTTDDIVTFNSKVASHIFPSHNAADASDASGKDLGDSNNYWRKVYAKEYAGKFTGTLTSRNIKMTGDVLWDVNFDASANVEAVGTIQPGAVDESMLNITNAPSTDNAGYFLKLVDENGTLTWSQVGAGDGVSLKFTDLRDTPTAYASGAGDKDKLVAVNSAGNALIFTDASSVGTDTYVTGASFVTITGGKQLQLTRNNSEPTLTANLTLSDLGGVNKFLDLTDVTPSTYDGQAHKFVRVNKPNSSGPNENNGSGLEFIDATNFNSDFSFIGLSDTPTGWADNQGDKNKYVRVNDDGNGLVFDTATISAGTVDISIAGDNVTYYPTFVSGTSSGGKTIYQDTNGLTYNPSSNTLTTQDLSVTGNTTLGNSSVDDTVTWNAKSGTILPSGTLDGNNVASGTNLGSADCKWDTIHAKNITGTLTVDTSDKQVLYTSGTDPSVVAGSDTFTWDNSSGVLKVSRNPASEDNWAAITTDGGLEITRTHATDNYKGGAYVDFRDDPDYPAHDYIARIQVATHLAGGEWDLDDRGGLLFETGGTGLRHMLLTDEGTLGITRGDHTNATGASAIVKKSQRTSGFAPGYSRDSDAAGGYNIDGSVALDVDGTILLRANAANPGPGTGALEGGQITFCNSDDKIGYSIDCYGATAGTSLLRIIDEKTPPQPGATRGTQRYAINRSGALGIGDVGNEDWGAAGAVLLSNGETAPPVWSVSSGSVTPPGPIFNSPVTINRQNDASEGGAIILRGPKDNTNYFELDCYRQPNTTETWAFRVVDLKAAKERFKINHYGAFGVGKNDNFGAVGAGLISNGITGQVDWAHVPTNGAWWSTTKNSIPKIGTDGVMEIGRYLDFHGTIDYATTDDGRIDYNGTDFIFDHSIVPTGTINLGSSGARWNNIFVNDLHLSNESKKDEGGNDVDGTWGDWTLQEGEDNIYMINNRTGKKYKMNLTEVD
tara:strand:+ start:1855 stop:8673 length:6819 start_codon:yes stop_codon:yes gene_type:complete